MVPKSTFGIQKAQSADLQKHASSDELAEHVWHTAHQTLQLDM
jgi:hypothetical protein